VLSGIVLVLQRFFLCGRFVFGPDVRSLAVTIFLIVAPLVCFCVFVGRHLLHHYGNAGIAIIVVAAVYTVYVSSAIFYTLDRKCGVGLLAQYCRCMVIILLRMCLVSGCLCGLFSQT
jgi:hypothetical protein